MIVLDSVAVSGDRLEYMPAQMLRPPNRKRASASAATAVTLGHAGGQGDAHEHMHAAIKLQPDHGDERMRGLRVNYRYAQFSNVLDILRNEKPVKFFIRDDILASYITTSNEPVGEGEN